MQVGQNYITDMIESNVKTVNGQTETVKWYQFKVPIYEPDSTVGSISDFKSIRFMRMYLTNAKKDIILRFAEMNPCAWRLAQIQRRYDIGWRGCYRPSV